MKISDMLDCVIGFFALFILSFALGKHLGVKKLNFFFSFSLSACVIFLYTKHKVTQRRKYVKNKEEEKKLEKIKTRLKMNSSKQNFDFLTKLFTLLDFNFVKSGNKLVYKKYDVFILFKFEPITKDELCDFYKRTDKNAKTLIFCSELSDQSKNFAQDFNERIILQSAENLFALMKKVSFYPDVSKVPEKEKIKFSEILKSFLIKDNGKRFIGYGITLLIISLFAYFPIFYLLTGTILCVFGLIGRFWGKIKSKEDVFG